MCQRDYYYSPSSIADGWPRIECRLYGIARLFRAARLFRGPRSWSRMLRDWGGFCFFGDPSVSRPPFLVGDVERWGGGGESAFLGRVADCWLSGALDTVRGVDRVSCGWGVFNHWEVFGTVCCFPAHLDLDVEMLRRMYELCFFSSRG